MPPRPRRHLSAHPSSCQSAPAWCSVAKYSSRKTANISGRRSAPFGRNVAQLSSSKPANASGCRPALYECSAPQPSGSQSALYECSVAQTSQGEPSTPHKRRAVPVSQLHLRHRPILYPNTIMPLLFHCAILYHHGAAESDVGRAISSPSRIRTVHERAHEQSGKPCVGH